MPGSKHPCAKEEPVKWEIPAGWFYVRSARVIPEDVG